MQHLGHVRGGTHDLVVVGHLIERATAEVTVSVAAALVMLPIALLTSLRHRNVAAPIGTTLLGTQPVAPAVKSSEPSVTGPKVRYECRCVPTLHARWNAPC